MKLLPHCTLRALTKTLSGFRDKSCRVIADATDVETWPMDGSVRRAGSDELLYRVVIPYLDVLSAHLENTTPTGRPSPSGAAVRCTETG